MSGPLSTNLATQAGQLAGPASLSAQGAALALQAGVKASSVTLTGTTAVATPGLGRSTEQSAGSTASGFAIQLTIDNAPTGAATQVYTGALVFLSSSEAVLVAGPPSSSNIPPAVGLILTSGPTLWDATAGQEGATLSASNLGACPNTLPTYVTACSVASFTNVGFDITASTLLLGTATGGQPTPSMTNTGSTPPMPGLALTIDCSKTTICTILQPSISSVTPSSGTTAGGTLVTIKGANFRLGAKVNFGSLAAGNVTVTNSTTITAATPAATAGTVDVTVTNLDGQSATLAGGFVYSSGTGPTATLNGQNGLAFENGQLYVANYGNDQVLVFNEAGTASSPTLSLSAIITPGAGLVAPTRLAFDATGRYLFVTYGHQGSAGSVAVYDTQSSNAQVALVTDSHIYGPLGVAVDAAGNLYVAENSGNSITMFTPKSATDPSQGYTFSYDISSDYAGHSFTGPGALAFFVDPLNSVGYLLVGLNSGNVLAYPTPLNSLPMPAGGSTCTGGVTAIALSIASEQLYVSYYYGADVVGYALTSILGSACPTAADTASGLHSPEGLAVDANQNVIVSNAGTSQLVIYPATLGTSIYTYGP